MPGLRSSGTLVVSANVSGEPINVGGNVALYHKGTLYRLDVLTLGFPGTSGGLSALASTLIGPGGVSLLYDGATGATTAWSNQNKTYYQMARPARAGVRHGGARRAERARRPERPARRPGEPRPDPARRAERDDPAHRPQDGQRPPTTDIDVQMKRQLPGKPLEDYHAQVALADDLGEFPVQIAFASVPATKTAFGGTMKLDLTSVVRETPEDAVFAVPAGYTRVTSLSGVLGHSLGG